MRLSPLSLLVSTALLGCINTDTAIFVDPTLSAPTAMVSTVLVNGVPFGTSLSGSFTLDLHLGARAAGPSMVTLGQFAILDATQTTSLVPALKLTEDVSFPATLQPGGSDVVAHFTFNTGADPLMSSAKAGLCAGAGVVISGSIEDSLAGRSVPVTSPGFQPTCM